MNNEFYNTELLIRYLDKELSAEEMIALEQRLAAEQGLREELERLKLAREAVRLHGLKQQVKKIHTEMRGTASANPIIGRNNIRAIGKWTMRIAAVVVLVVLGVGVYQYATLSNEKLFAEQYQPYEMRASRGAETESPVEAAYKKKDFPGVIAVFNNVSTHATADYFLVGQAYLQQNNNKEAIRNLELANASADTSHLYKDESEYYLALAYLKDKQTDKALRLFKKIHSDPGHSYRDKVNRWFLRRLSLTSD